MKVLELKGYKSLRALNAFSALMLGMKMLPAYLGETYETFLTRFDSMGEAEQESLLKEAALFVELSKDEIEALASFCCDPNGIPYEPSNIKNLTPKDLVDVIVAVCMEIGKMKIDIISQAEKKN
jgi:hypothetical protein